MEWLGIRRNNDEFVLAKKAFTQFIPFPVVTHSKGTQGASDLG